MPITKKANHKRPYPPTASWDEVMLPLLREDPEFAAYHLASCLREESEEIFLRALRDVIKAYGGFSAFARLSGMNRTNLHRALSPDGNPTWSSLKPILQALGIEMTINPKKSKFIKAFQKPDKKPIHSSKRSALKRS